MIQKIQASISGYNGMASTVFSVYDTESGVLVVAKVKPFIRNRQDDCLVITNDSVITRDSLYSQEDFKESITAFNAIKNSLTPDGKSSRLVIKESANMANPDIAIELDKVEESGPKYILRPDITNAQVACLATCLMVSRSGAVNASIALAKQLADMTEEHYVDEYTPFRVFIC